MMMSSQEVTVELLSGDGYNYKSWSVSIYNAFMNIDPDLRQIFSRSIFPSNVSKNPSNDELRCLSLNHHACNILVDSLSRSAYFAIMSSDSDLFVDAHDLWTKLKLKFFKSICTTSAPSIAGDTNLSKGEEQERWQPNDESTSSTGLSSTGNKCLITNNDGGDKSDDEEEYEDEESTSSQGTFSSFSVTLLRLNVYYLIIHGTKKFSNQHLLPNHHISTCYSMQYNGSSSLISCEKQTIRIKFLSLQGKPKHTRWRGTLSPHTSTVPFDSPPAERGSPPWRTMPH
jgi:hypothetical protein